MVGAGDTLPERAFPAETGSQGIDLDGELQSLRIAPPDIAVPFDRRSDLDRPLFLTPWDRTEPVESPELVSLFAELPRPELVGYVFANRGDCIWESDGSSNRTRGVLRCA